MLDDIRKNVDKKTVDKIGNMLNTPDGKRLLAELQKMDKNQLMMLLKKKGVSDIDFNKLNQMLQNTDASDILRRLNGGGNNGR